MQVKHSDVEGVGRLAAAACAHFGVDPSRVGEVVFRLGGGGGPLRLKNVAVDANTGGAATLTVEADGGVPLAAAGPDGDAPAAASGDVGAAVLRTLGIAPELVRAVSLHFAGGGAVVAHVERYVTVDEAARLVAGPLPLLASQFAWHQKGKVVRQVEEVPHTPLPAR